MTRTIEVPVNASSAERAIKVLRHAIETGRTPLPRGASVVSIDLSYTEFVPRPWKQVAIDDLGPRADQPTPVRSCYVLALTIAKD